MLKRLVTLFCLMCTAFAFSSHPIYRGVTFNDERVSKLITVIIPTSLTPSAPDIENIYDAHISLFRIPALRSCKKIIAFDSLPTNQKGRAKDYEQYKRNLTALAEFDPFFRNTQFVFCEKWENLSGTIKEAIKHVTTPYIFIHQHNLLIQKDFDLNGALATLIANSHVRCIHFAEGINNDTSGNGPVDQEVSGSHFVPLTRSFGWSDRSHLTSIAFYKKTVLTNCDHCLIENKMRSKMSKIFNLYGKGAHLGFGTYLYGTMTDGQYITQLNL